MNRKFLTPDEVNEIAKRAGGNSDVYDLVFTVRSLYQENLELRGSLPLDSGLMSTVSHGLLHALRDHGPITRENLASAAKRICGRLQGTKYVKV